MPRKDHLPRQTRQEHITLQPNRSIEFRVTDDFGSFSPPHWHDALETVSYTHLTLPTILLV